MQWTRFAPRAPIDNPLVAPATYLQPSEKFAFHSGLMSVSALRQLFTRLLNRFLKCLRSFRRLPHAHIRFINHLFAFLASFRRRVPTNSRRQTLHQPQDPPTSSSTPANGIVCAMSVPSTGLSDAHERGRPSPVDLPQIYSRSPSGHLIPPSPARRSSRDDNLRIFSTQTSLHEEPDEMNHNTSHLSADSILGPSSSPTIYSHHGSYTPNPDTLTHSSNPPSTVNFAPDTRPGTPDIKSSPRPAHRPFNINHPEFHQSRKSLSVKSSRSSLSSRSSAGRSAYREHHGPPARPRTPAARQRAPINRSPLTAEPFLTVAPPDANNPSQLGEANDDDDSPRFLPVTTAGVIRYDPRKTK